MAFASFDRQSSGAPVSEINMVPLIDVMLVLLVIFIVTAPLLTHSVKLQLPQATSQENLPVPDKIEFAIDAEGQRYWNGERVSREEAAQDVPYRHVAQTLADATKAGLSKVGFVSQPEP